MRNVFGSLLHGRARWRVAAVAAVLSLSIATVAATLWRPEALHRVMAFGFEDPRASEPLSVYAPQGSLLSIEAPNFAALLNRWVSSPEERAWLGGEDYAAFSRSRLFSRLSEARNEFAASAGLSPDAKFLTEVAGHESLFAWYDIGKLEFLYVTRMAPGEAAKTPLMQLADKFQLRRVGNDTFYIRTDTGTSDQSTGQGEETSTARTVAFAVHGDLLLLATREDLIANALLLAQHQGDASLHNEAWYKAATSAGDLSPDGSALTAAATPDMRMALNLSRIVPSPYFRSYWVQRNITELKQYSAAVSDLYLGNEAFREERVLIPKSQDMKRASGDLTPVLTYLPADTGVYRATAEPSSDMVLDELNRMVLSRAPAPYRDLRVAPVADLSDTFAGSGTDLESRIDEQPVPQTSPASAFSSLRGLVDSAHPESMLIYSSSNEPSTDKASNQLEANTVFFPIHSAVVLSANLPWDPRATEIAVTEALGARLTVAGTGLGWQERQQGDQRWMQLSGLQPIAIAIRGDVLIVASDSGTLLELIEALRKNTGQAPKPQDATVISGFSHSAERERFLRLTGLLDRNRATQSDAYAGGISGSPPFFSKNLSSLSDTFRSLDSETFTEVATPGHAVRQTVIYRWKH